MTEAAPPPALPVVRAVRFCLAHAPGLVRYGSKPARDLAAAAAAAGNGADALAARMAALLRDFPAALAYPPNRVLIGALHPDALAELPRPWYAAPDAPAPGAADARAPARGAADARAPARGAADARAPAREGPHGELLPEVEFLAWLKLCDAAGLVSLAADFVAEVRPALARHRLVTPALLERLGPGVGDAELDARLHGDLPALPLLTREGRRVGCLRADHAQDATLAADVLLENLACKASAALALGGLLAAEGVAPESIGYVLNSGEEAVGDRYQRGGGNLAKAVAEQCGLSGATGADVKAFCAGPLHALALAGALVAAGVFPRVAVIGGCSLAKLGMKYAGHLQHGQPLLEDTLAAAAVLVERDDGRSPRLRLDALGRHTVAAGASQQAVFEALVAQPLAGQGLRFADVDKYATELHNPELTEPAGSGDVPALNYRVIAGLAVLRGELAPADLPAFVARHGMRGFAPTQGHIASALPFLGHALDGLRDGRYRRVMLLAKGSLFLGRMTQLADGLSLLLERNPGLDA
jgi:glycine/sarcosine/betaine reductase complex component C subunit beta